MKSGPLPTVVQRDDFLSVSSATYDFGFGGVGTATHALTVKPISETVGPDTLVTSIDLTEASVGKYTMGATDLATAAQFTANEGAGTLAAAPATTIFQQDGSGVELLLRNSVF